MLGRSDLGIITLRRIFFRELQALRNGQPTKVWRRRPHVGVLPTPPKRSPAAEAAPAQ
jgi:5,5'-dehydrodivanillate O-demethylase